MARIEANVASCDGRGGCEEGREGQAGEEGRRGQNMRAGCESCVQGSKNCAKPHSAGLLQGSSSSILGVGWSCTWQVKRACREVSSRVCGEHAKAGRRTREGRRENEGERNVLM
eukprot:3535572-Rhodomonas_salina.1